MKIGLFISLALSLSACTAIQKIKKNEASAYLHLEVKPKTAIVYVDEQLYGEINTFRGQTVGLRPGKRRVEIRATGFESERFDLILHSGEQVTLTLKLISKLEVQDSETTEKKTFLKRPHR